MGSEVYFALFMGVLVGGCFGNLYTCISVFCIIRTVFFVLFLSCIFILICYVCTCVRTTATE